jgi:hypothetical protein
MQRNSTQLLQRNLKRNGCVSGAYWLLSAGKEEFGATQQKKIFGWIIRNI